MTRPPALAPPASRFTCLAPPRVSRPPPPRLVADLILLHSADPHALLAHAAAPFCAATSEGGPRPVLAVRQGGIRDQLRARAARAGAPRWPGTPVVVFAELPTLLAGALAPLTALERRVLLERLLDRAPLRALARARHQRGVVDALDRLLGDLVSERVAPETLGEHGPRALGDAWEAARDGDVAALLTAYRDAVAALPPRDGVPRSDGRDGLALAAAAVRARPDDVQRRLRAALGAPGGPLAVAIYGLNDLRRGWDDLLDALRAAPCVDEVRVYLPLDEVAGDRADADRDDLEAIGEFELLDALIARRPDRVTRLAPGEPAADALVALRGALFRASAAPVAYRDDTPVRAIAAPDVARELDTIARRIKRLIVDDGVAPHDVAIVSRKSRPYGPRAVAALRRHGVPVSAALRANLAEVAAVAALLRVFGAAAEGFSWRALAEIGESPYFDLDLDVGLLKRASARGRHRSLDGWGEALDAMVLEAEHAARAADGEASEEHRGPDVDRARRAAESFAAFRAAAGELGGVRPREAWIALALRSLGRAPGGDADGAIGDGLWGLRRNACRAPHDDGDALAVDAARRDGAALDALAGLLVEWRGALALRDGAAAESLSAARWHAELLDAVAGVEITPRSPDERGVRVLEASAAVWQTFGHLFLVGMSAGEFPAEPSGRELFAEHEREARYAAGLPLDPARVWFAREASLLRTLVGGARGSLHVSHAYGDADGAARIPSAYFDEIVARFASAGAGRADAWVETCPGSRVVPDTLDDVWCAPDLALFAARRWCDDAGGRGEAEAALAHLASDDARRATVQRVLGAAAVEHERRALRAAPPADRAAAARPWNGAVTSPDLVAALDARFGDVVWSASQLEAYGRCPFTFFVQHVLGVRPLDEPEEDMDGAARGALLHVCLDRLHGGLAAELGDEAFTPRSEGRAEKLIPDIVRRALDEFEKTGRGGVRALRGHRERELAWLLRSYLRWEVAENGKAQRRATPRRRPLRTEVVFGMHGAPPVALTSGDRVLRLRGRIDRVDALTEPEVRGWRYVVDHKTSDASLAPLDLYDEGALLQLPLYIRALERLDADAPGVWGGAYQVVKDECRRAAALHPRSLQKGKVREGGTATEQTAASRVHDAVALALRHVDGVRRGEFPARLPACARSCPTFCDARDVCREDRVSRGGAKR